MSKFFKCLFITVLSLIPMFSNLSAQESLPVHKVLFNEKPKLVLYYTPSCPYCKKVLRYLNQINKTIPLKNVQQDKKAREELIRVGGKSQVPCLFINGKPMYESNDIINWLSNHVDQLD